MKTNEEIRLDKAIEILKNASADIADLVGVDVTILLFSQVSESLKNNLHYIKTGEGRK